MHGPQHAQNGRPTGLYIPPCGASEASLGPGEHPGGAPFMMPPPSVYLPTLLRGRECPRSLCSWPLTSALSPLHCKMTRGCPLFSFGFRLPWLTGGREYFITDWCLIGHIETVPVLQLEYICIVHLGHFSPFAFSVNPMSLSWVPSTAPQYQPSSLLSVISLAL